MELLQEEEEVMEDQVYKTGKRWGWKSGKPQAESESISYRKLCSR